MTDLLIEYFKREFNIIEHFVSFHEIDRSIEHFNPMDEIKFIGVVHNDEVDKTLNKIQHIIKCGINLKYDIDRKDISTTSGYINMQQNMFKIEMMLNVNTISENVLNNLIVINKFNL